MIMKIITVTPSSRSHDWVSKSQIIAELLPFFDKVKEVTINSNYSFKTKEIVQSIYEYLERDEIISWKQYDVVINAFIPKPTIKQIKTVTRSSSSIFNHLKSYLDEKHWDHAFDDSDISLGDL